MAKETRAKAPYESLFQAALKGHLRIPGREDGLTVIERARMEANDPTTLLPSDDIGLWDMPTSYEIEAYGLKPWYHFMPVAIQIRPIGKNRAFIDRHYACDKGFQTPHDRMRWKNWFEEDPDPDIKCLILEDGEEWAEFVANELWDALNSWAVTHTCILSEQ